MERTTAHRGIDRQHGRGFERRGGSPARSGSEGGRSRDIERSIDERPIGGGKLLFRLPGKLGKVFQGRAERGNIERSPRIQQVFAAGEMVGDAPESDRTGPRLKVHRPDSEQPQVGPRGRCAQVAFRVREKAAQLGDELRALVARREPAPPDTHWVAHEQ
jgi:hypothetical protein